MVFFSIFSFFFQNSSIQKNKINNFVKIEEFNFQLFYNFYNFFKKERDYFLNFFQNINNIVFTNSDFFNFFFISYWVFKNFCFLFVDTIFFIFFKINKININIEKLNNKIINKFKKNELNVFLKNKNFFKIKSYIFKKTNNFYYLNILFENFCFFFKNKNKIILVLKKINNYYIKHNNYFIMKFLKKIKLDSYQIFFLRKNRVFNKGRYSRNRQNFRTGVYWCLYVNILAVLGIYYFFYKFTINFGYLWWLFIFSINCFFFNKFFKYNIFSINKIFFFFKKLISWYFLFFFYKK